MRYDVAVYNVGPVGENGRGEDDMDREVRALARSGAEVICLLETVGWGDCPGLEGYQKIRDRSTEGRGNITAYLSLSIGIDDSWWHDRGIEWQRWNNPQENHPARSDLEVRGKDGSQWGFWHQPPRGIREPKPGNDWITDEAQQEGVDLWTRRMAPWLRDDWSQRTADQRRVAKDRLRVLLGDPNRDPEAPLSEPGPRMLASRIGGWAAGTAIEGGVIRGGHFVDVRKQATVNAVPLGSDHHGAFFATVVDDRP